MEVRVLYYGDKKEDMRKEENCNKKRPYPLSFMGVIQVECRAGGRLLHLFLDALWEGPQDSQ